MGYRGGRGRRDLDVGREMLNILAEREFPADEIAAVASPRSTGRVIDFGDSGRELKVRNIEHFDFAGWVLAQQCGIRKKRNVMTAPFDLHPLLAPGTPPPAVKWNGFPKYNFVGGHNDPRHVPVQALLDAATAC